MRCWEDFVTLFLFFLFLPFFDFFEQMYYMCTIKGLRELSRVENGLLNGFRINCLLMRDKRQQ
ncbi:MAG: hypothetical protein EWV84_11985 [Microcystis sp. M_QC_C_20170808_M3Col]|nr:MAG: hypothetical protein EWV84_11985 [Microcystis sp. M_QC_C_20170808_M3Col]